MTRVRRGEPAHTAPWFFIGADDALYNVVYRGSDFIKFDGEEEDAPHEIDQGIDWITPEPRMPSITLRVPAPAHMELQLVELLKPQAAAWSAAPSPDHGHHADCERIEAVHGAVNLDRLFTKPDFEEGNLSFIRPVLAYCKHQRDDRYGTLFTGVGQRKGQQYELTLRPEDWGEESQRFLGRSAVIRGGELHVAMIWGLGTLLTSSAALGLGTFCRVRKRVRGRNPPSSVIRARILEDAMKRGLQEIHQRVLLCIAYQESRFTQFFDDQTRWQNDRRSIYFETCASSDPLEARGLPLYGASKSPGPMAHGGFGVFQLDNPDPAAYELWDWRANIAAASALYVQKIFDPKHGALARLQGLYRRGQAAGAKAFRVEDLVREFAVGFNGGHYLDFWDSVNGHWQPGPGSNAYADAIWKWYYMAFELGRPPQDW